MSSGSKVSRPELFAAASPSQRRQFVASLDQQERNLWEEDFLNSAHPGQLPPDGDWLTWLVMGGRGFGKTRAGAEWVRRIAEGDGRARIALVAASMAEARSVMIEGESGLIACSPEYDRPVFEPSLHRLRWSNGAQAFLYSLYSAAEPESLRGPQHSHASRGQAQKEFFVNEAHVLLDALVHSHVYGMADIPPANPAEGDAWLVQPAGQGEWNGHDHTIAVFTAGGWRFILPQPGMRIFDSASGRQIHFDSSWKFAAEPGLPTGGATIDLEAREAIGQLVTALRELGLIARAQGSAQP